ncbi:MAG: bifunctional UDP-N-acetylglucosamine diphosphorylase/glucosamine-1-phosphate N-acetyltransferase GlmU [Pseudomonadota bacterium]
MNPLKVLILAAGKGTRMKSGRPKVLFDLCGRPLLSYPLALAARLGAGEVICVVGHQAGRVREAFEGEAVTWVEQVEQLGTGHAVLAAAPHLEGFGGEVLILCGDVPLLTRQAVDRLLAVHRDAGASLSLLTMVLDEPGGYGRLVRGEGGRPERIVEARDCTPEQLQLREVNSGIYCVSAPCLIEAVPRLKADNAQGEYYLTDVVGLIHQRGLGIATAVLEDPQEALGINDRVDLARAARVLRERVLRRLMLGGVTVVDPNNTYVEGEVEIGADTVILPGASIGGRSRVGKGCLIESWVNIRDCIIEDGARILHGSVCEGALVGPEAQVGPFGRLRPGAELGPKVRVGNFVEVKKSRIGAGSKVNHLSYIGDATIGSGVNIGAGTITCNYDGTHKHQTIIGDGAFIGSNTQFVAPVEVGAGALVGAGSTITRDVPPDMLAIARGRQVNLPRGGESPRGGEPPRAVAAPRPARR